ncbi:DUF3149 domain-containing protein [Idiomarina ramblicola]|uniref:DUF3149 domain-containing protein n=1 Tax=Idiomarina ramblicola TaxID=263724 RepID=A0A432Z5Q5_9GAMM|nr:DUF3149 domain-containing protein [Idiomarina ramblicola]RUO73248.1 DUF3149 domain-containing protein [Idiomarina ramblicola]
MSLWQEFLNDPVIFFSFSGLAIVLGLCAFYAIFFYIKMIKSEKNVSNKLKGDL